MMAKNDLLLKALFLMVFYLGIYSIASYGHIAPKQCKGMKISFFCGNSKCDEQYNETPLTCPRDCKDEMSVNSFTFKSVCKDVKKVFTPKSIQDVQSILSQANEHNLPVKFLGASHSFNSTVCTDGYIVYTKHFNKIIGLEDFQGEQTVKVQGGVTIRDLLKWLHQRGKSLGFAHPLYPGATIAGAVATGSHGSSKKHHSVISAIVRSMRVVDSNGKAREYHSKNTSNTHWNSLKVHMGSLGFVSELRLKVEDDFNLHFKVTPIKEKAFFKDEKNLDWGPECDYDHLVWLPSAKKMFKICGNKTNLIADENAHNAFLLPDPEEKSTQEKNKEESKKSSYSRKTVHWGRCLRPFNCLLARTRFSLAHKKYFLRKNNSKGVVTSSDDVVGEAHKMLTSEISSNVLMYTDWSLGVGNKQIAKVMKFIKNYLKTKKLCLPMAGITVRFSPPTEAWLSVATQFEGKEKHDWFGIIEFLVYEPKNLPVETLSFIDRDVNELIEKLIDRFDVRLHMGKNQEWAIRRSLAKPALRSHRDAFYQSIERFNSDGFFSTTMF